MSHNHGATSAPPSRRSVVKGAAWAVPAVVVAGAAPTVAASVGPLEFTGGACKLPGNSSDILKGYVFELIATNTAGPNPTTAITVVSNVAINGTPVSGFSVDVRSGTECVGSCASTNCGFDPDHVFCTPDGTSQQILVYTADEPTGDSKNAEMTLTYQRYECLAGGTCTPVDATPQVISSGVRSTPPATPGGGSCNVDNVFPLPTGT